MQRLRYVDLMDRCPRTRKKQMKTLRQKCFAVTSAAVLFLPEDTWKAEEE